MVEERRKAWESNPTGTAIPGRSGCRALARDRTQDAFQDGRGPREPRPFACPRRATSARNRRTTRHLRSARTSGQTPSLPWLPPQVRTRLRARRVRDRGSLLGLTALFFGSFHTRLGRARDQLGQFGCIDATDRVCSPCYRWRSGRDGAFGRTGPRGCTWGLRSSMLGTSLATTRQPPSVRRGAGPLSGPSQSIASSPCRCSRRSRLSV